MGWLGEYNLKGDGRRVGGKGEREARGQKEKGKSDAKERENSNYCLGFPELGPMTSEPEKWES